jgi:hypothetical protein
MKTIAFLDRGTGVKDLMYRYYGDLFRELCKSYAVDLYSDPLKIDPRNYYLIIYGPGWFANCDGLLGDYYATLDTNTPVIGILHKHQHHLKAKLEFIKRNKFDLIADPDPNYLKNALVTGKPSTRFWFSASPEFFYPDNTPRVYDIGFSGALHGGAKLPGETKNIRNRAHDVIQGMGLNVFWNGSDSVAPRIKSWEEYAARIRECKVWLATTGPIHDVSPRYFELALSKTLILCNESPQSYKGLFIQGETCVTFKNDLSDLERKLQHYLEDYRARTTITETAHDFISRHYTNEKIAKGLVERVLR